MTWSLNELQHWHVASRTTSEANGSDLVARDRELAAARDACAAAHAGQGRLMLISGEAGIGKSALVRELLADLAAGGVRILLGACYDLTTTPPYGPWIDAFRHYQTADDLPPFIADPDSFSDLATREELFNQVIAYLHRLAERETVAVVLEDLHWSDESSLELIRVVARRIQQHRIVVIGTYRDSEITREHRLFRLLPNLVRESNAERVQLRPLSEAETREFTLRLYPVSPGDLDTLTPFLFQRTGGNPLFIQESLRQLEIQGNLRDDGDRWRLDGLDRASVPSLVQQMIEGRLTHLSSSTLAVIQTIAVMGEHVPIRLASPLTGDSQLLRALEEAEQTGLLEVNQAGRLAGFRHALVREAVHESIPLPIRRERHQMVADFYLEFASPDPDSVAYHLREAEDPRAAEWLIRAGEQAERRFAWRVAIERYIDAVDCIQRDPREQARIAGLMLRAGELLRFSDPARANEYLETALDAAIASDQQEIAAHACFGIGQNLCNLGQPRPGLVSIHQAINSLMSETSNGTTSTGWPMSLIDPAHQQPVTWLRGSYAYFLVAFGRIKEATEVAEADAKRDWREAVDGQAFRTIASESKPGNRNTYLALGHSLALTGHPVEAGPAFNLALEINRGANFEPHNVLIANLVLLGYHFPYRADQPRERAGLVEIVDQWTRTSDGVFTDPFLPGYEYLLLWEGRWDELRTLVEANPNPILFPNWSLAMMIRASLARYIGDPGSARSYLRRLLPEGSETRPEDHVHLSPGEAHRVAASLAIDEGDYTLARAWMSAHDAWLDWSGARLGRAHGLLVWAKIRAGEGDTDTAASLANEALARATDPYQPIPLIAIHRFLGERATSGLDLDSAEHHLSASLQLAEECQFPYERALTLLSIAELQIARGDRGTAGSLLDDVRTAFVGLGARPALDRVSHLNRAVATDPVGISGGLTPREQQVLALIVQGLTDRQIAERLFISHRTVMRHVSHILRKLDVDSRTAAAALAVRENLI